MFTAAAFIILWAFLTYNDAKNQGGLKWYEVKDVTRYLLTGMVRDKSVKCRACGGKLPDDPLWHVELSPGVYVHEDCSESILLEAGLEYPSWFTEPLPPEDEEPKQIEEAKPEVKPEERTFTCSECNEQHPMDYICMKEMIRVWSCQTCGKVTCDCEKKAEKKAEEWAKSFLEGGAGGGGGSGVVYIRKNPYQSELVLQRPNMNTVITDVTAPPPELPHNCHFCAKPIVSKGLCDRCIMWGSPGGFLPCDRCTYYHEEGDPHPEVFIKATEAGRLHEFVERRVREGYNHEKRWSWRGW